MANTKKLVEGFYKQQAKVEEKLTMTATAIATMTETATATLGTTVLYDNYATCRHMPAHSECKAFEKITNKSKNKYCNFSKSICNIENNIKPNKRNSNNASRGNDENKNHSSSSSNSISGGGSSGSSCCGNSSCTASLSLFHCSCLNSPNSIITTINCCMKNIRTCWWWWWCSKWCFSKQQQQEKQYKIKSKTLKHTSNVSLTFNSTHFHSACKPSLAIKKQQQKRLTTPLDFCSLLKWYFFVWLLLSILAPCTSLSMTEVRIPKHIMRYETASLGCKYDLDGESLYSVKWYKDGFEFYRYVPRDNPPGQVFPLPGVDVDLQNSTDNVVVLNRVTLQSTGRYRCEVSGEAPSFQTVSGHEDMIVVVTPSRGPQITGGQPRYSIGEKVSVNCTSAPSKPICHLSWLINGVHANRSYLRYYEPKIVGREGLEVATLGLEFRVRG